LWALNGSIAKFLLDDRMPSARLAELRAVGTFLAIALALALARPRLLRIQRADVGLLAILGGVGLAGNTVFYFAAIARLQIGVALTIQYLAPVLLLVWLRLAYRRRLPKALWGAAAVAVIGCFVVVGAYDRGGLDGVGVVAALASAVTFAIYLFTSEQAGQRYAPVTTLVWGFGFAALFWAITQPMWTFPTQALASPRNALFAAYVVIGGTLVPFACMFTAVRHIPAPRAAVVATLEPVLAAVLAWLIHGQALAPVQIAGGLVVIGAIIWIQVQRPQLDAELAPTYTGGRRAPQTSSQ
jgi:drug/metabolite transporter (DMT)-like permease